MKEITFKYVWNWACRNTFTILLVFLTIVLSFIVSGRVQQKKIADTYDKGIEAGYVAAELAFTNVTVEPTTLADGTTFEQVQIEAQYAARVLYGVQDNTRAGLKLTTWCIINRAQNKAYPNNVVDVCKQELQWMGYSDENQVIKNLYDICYEELVYWHNGGPVPMSSDYVFLAWTPDEIILRTDYMGKNRCKYFDEVDWAEFEGGGITA